MQRLPEKAWAVILSITAGHDDSLEEVARAVRDVAAWRSCLHVEMVSRRVRQLVHPCLVRMQVSHTCRLLILVWKMRREIKIEVDLEQLDSMPWSPDNRKCAMRQCKHRTGLFVPWHAHPCHPGGSSYVGAVSTSGEAAGSSIHGSIRIDDWMDERGLHLVVCSIGCLQKINCLKALWPREAEEESWRILRGTEAFLDGPAT